MHLLGDRGPIVISERTKAGMPAARRRGLHVGRPLKLDPKQLVYARRMIVAGGSRAGSRRSLGVDPSALRRLLMKGFTLESKDSSAFSSLVESRGVPVGRDL
ncbi:MAG: hypothetical protein CR217_18725 [Beijerinckiaceae bacterium]|nr:MAG: hypothetical protein CR217_18725 [Beijerinckiaceae bacterium]